MSRLNRTPLLILVWLAAFKICLAEEPLEAPRRSLMAESEIQDRLDFIQSRFDARQKHATKWWRGWLAGYSLLTVGQGTVYVLSSDPGLRADTLVGAAGSSLGLLSVAFAPMHSRSAATTFRSSASNTPATHLAKLEQGERLLRQTSEEAELATSWLAHAASTAVAIASGLTLWLVYDRPVQGGLTFGAGLLIGQSQIRTYPAAPISDWREYQRRFPEKPLGVAP
jgi:hypothetical protein